MSDEARSPGPDLYRVTGLALCVVSALLVLTVLGSFTMALHP